MNVYLDEFLNNKYKKAFYTNLDIDISRKGIEEKDISKILDNNLIQEKADEILWYFYSDRLLEYA